MSTPRRRSALPTILLAGALALSGCSVESDPADPAPAATSSQGGGTTATAAGDEAHNAADVAFLQGMIPHHAQAITMSDMFLAQDDSTITELAEQIKAAQQPEIDTMTGWLEEWGEEVPDSDGHMGMGGMDMDDMGMMSPDDMDDMGTMSGAGFDRMWLQMMIEHHEGAVEMAKEQEADGQHAGALALAADIVTTQEAEIVQMEAMLEDLDN